MSHTDINGKRESLSYVNDVVGLLSAHRIPSCVVGELALNYFNVPRVVHVRFQKCFQSTNYQSLT